MKLPHRDVSAVFDDGHQMHLKYSKGSRQLAQR
jgi:hypothetical protein